MKLYWVEFYLGAPGKVSAIHKEDIYRWFPGNIKLITLLKG